MSVDLNHNITESPKEMSYPDSFMVEQLRSQIALQTEQVTVLRKWYVTTNKTLRLVEPLYLTADNQLQRTLRDFLPAIEGERKLCQKRGARIVQELKEAKRDLKIARAKQQEEYKRGVGW